MLLSEVMTKQNPSARCEIFHYGLMKTIVSDPGHSPELYGKALLLKATRTWDSAHINQARTKLKLPLRHQVGCHS